MKGTDILILTAALAGLFLMGYLRTETLRRGVEKDAKKIKEDRNDPESK
jgi:hypothetical protein